ncbi:MAG: radical SAM protein [Acidimicrobiales bacterium]
MTRVQLTEHDRAGDGLAVGSEALPLLEPCEPLDGWGLSTYTRCAFGCRYCITGVQGASVPRVAADRLVAQLEAELAFHEPAHIGVGLFCDAYPPVEQELGLTRRALPVLLERGVDFRVITKGLTVWRDVDLLADSPLVGVNISLCSTREDLLRPFDGSAPTPRERLDLLHRLADAGVMVELALSPWIPGVTDTAALIEAVDPAIPIRITPLRVRAPKVIDTPFGQAWDQEEINAAFEREFQAVGERRNVFWSPGAPLDGSAPHITVLVSRPGREDRLGPPGSACACP